MTALPPPPLLGWQGIPPVWRRWFQGIFTRVGGSTGRIVVIDDDGSDASALDELEARVRAAIPERPNMAALEARIGALESQEASRTERPDVATLEARVNALEFEAASRAERPNVAALEARIGALEAEAAGRERQDVAALERRIGALEVEAASRD